MAADLVLVTGGSGYLATHVVKLLQHRGYNVRASVRSLHNEEEVAPLGDLCPNATHPLQLVEADLTDEASWVAAVKGCSYVIHIASPMSIAEDKEMVRTTVSGTLAVLRACDEGVKRVVFTSSIAAVNGINEDYQTCYTEDDWTTVKEGHKPYIKAKTLAERAAWDYVKSLPEGKRFELAVVNPGVVYGPVQCGFFTGSAYLPHLLLTGAVPGVPRMGRGMVDVRDVALAHVNAMLVPEAAGRRHLLVTHTWTLRDMARVLHAEFVPQGYHVPTSELTEQEAATVKEFICYKAGLNKMPQFDNSRMRTVLGIEPRSMKNTFIDMAYSMIEAGFVEKTEKYTGPKYSE